MSDLVVQRPEGLYCPQGDFYIDPWRPVARAVITHAHGDHARPYQGPMSAEARRYLCDVFEFEIRNLERTFGWNCAKWLEAGA